MNTTKRIVTQLSNTVSNRGFHFKADVFSLLLVLLLSGNVRSYGDDDWGPQLIPPHPAQAGEFRYDSDEFVQEEYAPQHLSSSRSYRPKQLPRPKTQRSRAASFDTALEPNESIIPLSFLEEDSHGGAISPPPTRSRPRRSLETPLEADGGRQGEEYYVEEYPASGRFGTLGSSFPMLAETEYPAEEGYGGVYNECSPVLGNCYAGPPVIKPFGTSYLDNLTVFAGMTGFKGEMDGGSGGNFGFTEGINWSIPLIDSCTVSGQLGFRAIQSNINGNAVVNKSCRNQYFVTGGFFRRDLSHPLQGGVVFDWFQDEYYGKTEVEQVRCELSVRTFSNLEYGFLGGFGTNKARNTLLRNRENAYHGTIDVDYRLRAENYFLGFFRKHWCNGQFGEIRLGATEKGDVILSGLAEFPVNDCLSFHGGFTTMFPSESRNRGAWRRETWDVSVGLVFYFRGGACDKTGNPCRPMFDVAGNGSFINRFRP